jgi:hypothetical protein
MLTDYDTPALYAAFFFEGNVLYFNSDGCQYMVAALPEPIVSIQEDRGDLDITTTDHKYRLIREHEDARGDQIVRVE